MRLLNAQTFEFEEFMNLKALTYAIVSHRWTDREVTLRDFPSYLSGSQEGHGWTKIQHACQITRSDNFQWVWVDTCCINKDSSAELTEAINSMFQWYQRARTCYVFLQDVRDVNDPDNQSSSAVIRAFSERTAFYEDQFKKSDWFRRGWTLQELLAPRELKFFNSKFQCIGSRAELSGLIAEASGIDRLYVEQPLSSNVLQDLSIAERMRWASSRETTKEEDMAYCLLGIFDVNMPLLYGEGKKAFIRLQLELIKKTDDESVFAWEQHPSFHPSDGLLASSPAAFHNRGIMHDPLLFHYPHSMTNKGLQMTLDIPDNWQRRRSLAVDGIKPVSRVWSDNFKFQKEHTIDFLLPLNCTIYAKSEKGVHEAHAVAIRFQATILKQNIAFLGYRLGALRLIPGSPGDNWLPNPRELDGAIVIGKDRVTKPWTVYFPQKGL
jgi:hypothetical protein